MSFPKYISKMDLETFPRFSQLVQEIKDTIWEFAILLQPRIVEVRSLKLYQYGKPTYDFVAMIPSILHACHESRLVGLRVSHAILFF
jgi:2EXR family